MRTMLPPNLTRHFWETRRAFLRSAGTEVEPWFQLTPAGRAVAESEVELLRQAIRAAEEEQDLLATLDTPIPSAAAAEPAQDAEDDCDCPGCSAVAAFLRLLAGGRKPADRTEAASPPLKAVPYGLLALLQPVRDPLSAQEMAYIENAARDAVDSWLAAGKPVEAAVRPEPATWTVGPFAPSTLNRLRWPSEEEFITDFKPPVTPSRDSTRSQGSVGRSSAH